MGREPKSARICNIAFVICMSVQTAKLSDSTHSEPLLKDFVILAPCLPPLTPPLLNSVSDYIVCIGLVLFALIWLYDLFIPEFCSVTYNSANAFIHEPF